MAKKKKGSDKISFFKIGGGGSIKPAFDKNEGTATAAHLPEPHLGPDTNVDAAPDVPEANPEIVEQLQMIRPQVEDIARMSSEDSLGPEQVKILRKYIALKEAEVRDIKDQKRQYQNFVKKLSGKMENNSDRSRDLVKDLETLRRRNEALMAEVHDSKEKHQQEIKVLKGEYEERLRMAGDIDAQVDHFSREKEGWKQKIKEDLKKIKLKERELENKYELLKRDSQALLDSKDRHVLELKKKCDALELELESLEERLRRNNSVLSSIDAKKKRLVETFRLAINMLEEIDQEDEPDQDSDEGREAG